MPRLRERKLKLSCSRTDRNPHMDDPKWQADHWKCTLSNPRTKRKMTFVYSKGSGHKGKAPSITEVLETMKMDTQSIKYSRDFNDWASDMGFDMDRTADYRRAKKIYTATKRQAQSFERVAGPVK